MKYKLIQPISVILIATFALQDLAWEQAKGAVVLAGVGTCHNPISPNLRLNPTLNYSWRISLWLKSLRPRAYAQRQDAEFQVVDVSERDDINSGLERKKGAKEGLIPTELLKNILCQTVLEEMGEVQLSAAKVLGLHRVTLSRYMKEGRLTGLPVLTSEERALFQEDGHYISVHKLESMLYRLALDITKGNQRQAAKLLGVGQTAVHNYLKREGDPAATLDAAWRVRFVAMLVKRSFFRESARILDSAETLGVNLDIVYEHILESRADIVTNGEDIYYDIVAFIEWIEREKIIKEARGKRLNREEYKEWLKQYVRGKTQEFQEALRQGGSLNAILPEAFAVFRQAALNTIGLYPAPEQVFSALAIHSGAAVEMLPGEGKTLSIAPPAYLNALTGKGVHIHTFNDYLARRDGQNMGEIFDFLGLKTGVIVGNEKTFIYGEESKTRPREAWVKNLAPVRKRKDAYQCDITYGEKDEFIFDYLRDNLVADPSRCRQRRQIPEIEILDEGDNTLIDEGHTPVILTGLPNGYAEEIYKRIYDFANNQDSFKTGEDYRVDVNNEEVEVADESARWKIEELFDDIPELVKLDYEEKRNLVRQALKAGLFFHKDEDYVVRGGRLIIVDEFTGRCKMQHMWSNHLHQFVEAKEGIRVSPKYAIGGMITYQSYYRRIKGLAKLSCVSGTIGADAKELEEVYGLRTQEIHAQRRSRRIDRPASYYDTDEERDNEIERRVIDIYNTGNPLLLFTSSIKAAHEWGERLSRAGVGCNIIDGQDSAKEAEVIGRAGNMWQVTVATNAPGRGDHIEYGKGVSEIDGLVVIMTFMNKNRRADEQLRARTARRGEPGWTETFISYQDELIRRFGMDAPQEKSEGHYRRLRARTLRFDEELDKSREEYYHLREAVLYSGLARGQKETVLTNMDRAWLIFVNKLDEIKYSGTIEQYSKFNQAEFSSLRDRIMHGRRISLASLIPKELEIHGFGPYLTEHPSRLIFASDLATTGAMTAESSILRPSAARESRLAGAAESDKEGRPRAAGERYREVGSEQMAEEAHIIFRRELPEIQGVVFDALELGRHPERILAPVIGRMELQYNSLIGELHQTSVRPMEGRKIIGIVQFPTAHLARIALAPALAMKQGRVYQVGHLYLAEKAGFGNKGYGYSSFGLDISGRTARINADKNVPEEGHVVYLESMYNQIVRIARILSSTLCALRDAETGLSQFNEQDANDFMLIAAESNIGQVLSQQGQLLLGDAAALSLFHEEEETVGTILDKNDLCKAIIIYLDRVYHLVQKYKVERILTRLSLIESQIAVGDFEEFYDNMRRLLEDMDKILKGPDSSAEQLRNWQAAKQIIFQMRRIIVNFDSDLLDIEKARRIVEELCGDEHIGRRLEAARFLKNNENYEEIKLPRRADTDTHMHSYHSDGYQTPTALVYEAWRRGLRAIALTDHNSVEGLPEAIEAGKIFDVEVIPAIEITTTHYRRYGTEILVYWPDQGHFLNWYGSREGRVQRKMFQGMVTGQEEMVVEAARQIGEAHPGIPALAATMREIMQYARNKIINPGILGEAIYQKCRAAGIAQVGSMPITSSQEAHDNLVVKFVKYRDDLLLTPKAAVRFAIDSGGVAVLAHPKQFLNKSGTKARLRAYIERLKEAGLSGIQVSDWRNKDEDDQLFRDLAKGFGLIPMVGSDYHGEKYSSFTTMGIGDKRKRGGNLDVELGSYGQIEQLRLAQAAMQDAGIARALRIQAEDSSIVAMTKKGNEADEQLLQNI